MLIEFTVGNYRSIREAVTLSMVAAPLVSPDKSVDKNNTIRVDDDLQLLKSAAIYGANASGKSNLVKAMTFMRQMVLNSSKESQAEDLIPVEHFRLTSDSADEPSLFECVFIRDEVQYRYGFEATPKEIVREWLYQRRTAKETRLFQREEGDITLGRDYREGKGLEDKTRNNALFLSVVAQFNGEVANTVLKWFRTFSITSGLQDRAYRRFTIDNLLNERYRGEILDFLEALDLGIHDISVESQPISQEALPADMPEDLRSFVLKTDVKTVRTIHRRYDPELKKEVAEEFELDQHESEGTRKLFALSGPFVDTLATGRVLVIDEFDARVHPLISRALVQLFNSNERNPKGAQLVLTTHDTNLLCNRIFRRDQIWFTEKDQHGATKLTSLAEIRVRNDAAFEKDYIHGKYGAIPFIGNIGQLVGDADAE